MRNWILGVEHENGGTIVESAAVLRDGGLTGVGGRADIGRAAEKVRGQTRGQNKYGTKRWEWETAQEEDVGQSCTANPAWFVWTLGLSPRLTWHQPSRDPAKMTSWSCHGHRARMSSGGHQGALPAAAD